MPRLNMGAPDPTPSRGIPTAHQVNPNTSCEIIRQLDRQDHAIDDATAHYRSGRVPPVNKGALLCKGAPSFTDDLGRVLWPTKFRPDLPGRYDGMANPTEFIQLYALSVRAAGGDDKVMANWFPMAPQEAPRTWLMNLPELSISSCSKLREAFIANFKGRYDRPLTINDLRIVHQ